MGKIEKSIKKKTEITYVSLLLSWLYFESFSMDTNSKLYTLNICNFIVCQLYLNKTAKLNDPSKCFSRHRQTYSKI